MGWRLLHSIKSNGASAFCKCPAAYLRLDYLIKRPIKGNSDYFQWFRPFRRAKQVLLDNVRV